ncbi:hypothetical protein N8T08_000798 [Aspergillus melleus]|uniref:Uncharacterized protein n=1 Tax=Aspergillus melleus TaxID=138277 RepID=A0ACC3AP93_9EURO|nr:hypothetical protein N8T08_000798 [Aspergillus melleus]
MSKPAEEFIEFQTNPEKLEGLGQDALYQAYASKSADWHKRMTRQLLRKVDLHLLPFLILMYLLNFLDRNNLSQARLGTLEEDLGMKGTDYNLATSILFVGYLLMQLPSNLLLTRVRPSLFLGIAMGIWGAISACQATTHSFAGLVVSRFFLGFVEAPFFPGAVMLMSSWYTRQELSHRIAWFYAGSSLANAFGGLIGAGVLGNLHDAHGIAGWRWLFIIEGCITVGVSVVAAFMLPNYPATTSWLDASEQSYAQWRLVADAGEADDTNTGSMKEALYLVFTDKRIYLFILLQHTSLLAQNFQYFFPTIVQTLGYDNIITLLITAPVWIATFLVSLVVTWTSGRTNDRGIHIIALMMVSVIGCIICTATTNIGAKFFGMFLMPMGAVSAYQIIIAWVANSFPRPLVKRSAAIAIANMLGNTASIYGSYMWPSSSGPRYIPGGGATAGVAFLVAVLAFIIRMVHALRDWNSSTMLPGPYHRESRDRPEDGTSYLIISSDKRPARVVHQSPLAWLLASKWEAEDKSKKAPKAPPIRSQESWTGIVRTVRDYATGTDPRDDYEPILGSLPDEETERQAHGVAEIEALATGWSTRTLYTGYALIVGGVGRLPIAMMIDIWGRPEGFGVTVALCTIGLMLMAACRNIETYVAAQIIYWLGYNGMDYVLHVFLSDTTDLVNRAFVYGVAGTPYIVTTFLGPAAAQQFYSQGALWWGFGIFAIVTPIVSAPLLGLLWSARRKARTAGLIRKEESGRTWLQSVQHYFTQFDTIGLVLITAAFVMILLPLTLASSHDSMWSSSLADRWRSPEIIAMLFIGCACVVGFVYWERFGATVCFVPFSRLKDRTLLGACLLSATMFASFYSWDLYLSSYLQVVFNTSIRDTGYIYNIYTIGTCFWSVPLGLFIRRVGRLKWIALAAMPLTFLGTGLMLHFRSPDSHLGSVIMCEVFKAIAGGTLVICQQMAAMATGGHETIAVSFALVGLFSKIGTGVGSAVSGAIWTSTVPHYLREALPVDKKHKAAELYGSIATVLSYPIGTPERDATIYAYGVAQKRMLVAGISILPAAVFAILMWEDIRLKKTRQVRGNVF